MNDDVLYFHRALKCSRLMLGLTQATASKFLDIPERTLWDWESGKTTPATITQEGALARFDEAWDKLCNKRQADEDYAFFEGIGKAIHLELDVRTGS